MVEDQRKIPRMYDEKSFKKQAAKSRRWHQRGIVRVMVVLVLLVLVRFINIALLYTTTGMELKANPNLSSDRYIFLGVAGARAAEGRLRGNYSDVRRGDVVAVCHTNMVHPFMASIRNDRDRLLFDLGRLAVVLPPGMVSVEVTSYGSVRLETADGVRENFFEEWLLRSLAGTWLNAGVSGGPGVSYALRPLTQSSHMKIPVLIYFYLPLVLIALMIRWYGAGFYAAFLYYVWFFLLFDFRLYLVEVPLSWLWNLLGIDLTQGIGLVIGLGMLAVVLILFTIGMSRWKRMDRRYWSRPLVVLFILMPIFLRF